MVWLVSNTYQSVVHIFLMPTLKYPGSTHCNSSWILYSWILHYVVYNTSIQLTINFVPKRFTELKAWTNLYKMYKMQGVMSHHSQCGAQKRTPSRLVHDPQTQVLQALWRCIHIRRGKRGVSTANYGILRQATSPNRPPCASRAVRQLLEVSLHVLHSEGRVWVQGDGWYFKLFIAKAGSVKGLLWNGEFRSNQRWTTAN